MSNPSRAALAVDDNDDQDQEDLKQIFDEARSMLEAGRADQALVPLRDILSRYPNHPDALNFASVAFGQLNMTEEAERFSREAIAKRPDDAGFHLNLANRLNDQGRSSEALQSYERALALEPGNVLALKSQLRSLIAAKRWPDARAMVEHLLAHVDDDAELFAECANACIGADDKRRALELYEEALTFEPNRIPWLLQLARLAITQNQIELAKTTGEHVLELEDHPEMRAMLASIMHRLMDLEGMAMHLDAIPDGSDQAGNAANLKGMMLVSQGKIREGLDQMARTETLAPEAFGLQATRVMYLNYDPDISARSLRAAHFAVGHQFADALPPLDQLGQALPLDPEKRLRIGFVSPDFRSHSVAYFARPYFESFDRDRFDVFAYAHIPKEDIVSEGLRQCVTDWRNVFDMTDHALAKQIHNDHIDILIDLAGYTRDTRLLDFHGQASTLSR